MTRETKAAAQRAAYRAASLLTGALILAGAAGCGGGLFQNSDSADASLTQKAKPSVALSPVQGVPQKYTSKVSDQLASTMKEKGVQIVDAKDAQYIIKAAYIAMPEARKGTKVTYAIDVTDKAGNRVRRIEGEELVSPKRGGDSWGHVTDEKVLQVAAKSANDLNAWIENPNAPPPAEPPAVAAATPAKPVHAQKIAMIKPVESAGTLSSAVETPPPEPAPAPAAAPARPPAAQSAAAAPVHTAALPPKGEVVAIVPVVAGAPGDGKTALADAMKRALARQGIKLAAAGVPGTYKIQGQVEMGAPANGEQPITIRWVVIDPSGKQFEKTVIQNNKVEAGKLDKTWGPIADQAAGAAAVEVTKLLGLSSSG